MRQGGGKQQCERATVRKGGGVLRCFRTLAHSHCRPPPPSCVLGLKSPARGADALGVHDYIPRTDGDFSAWAGQFVNGASEFFVAQGLDDPMILELQNAYGTWIINYRAQVAALNAARGATETKVEARRRLERAARRVGGFIQTYPATTDADRALMGITVRGTRTGGTPVPPHAPLIAAEQSARFTHRLRFVPPEGQEGIQKPRGVMGAELYVALAPPNAPPPEHETDFRYVRAITRDGVRVTFSAEQAGLIAYYRARWLTRTGDVGGWSPNTTAMVAA